MNMKKKCDSVVSTLYGVSLLTIRNKKKLNMRY